jgi:hypothetical protein
LWGTRVRRVVEPDRRQARAVARALSVMPGLSDELQAEVDRLALAVNSAWSLLAIWGSGGGYRDVEGFDSFGQHTFGCCSGHGTSAPAGMIGHAVMPQRELQRQVAGAIARCAATSKLTISVETTLDEIVDVSVVSATRDTRAETCAREAIWDTAVVFAQPLSYARTTFVIQPS